MSKHAEALRQLAESVLQPGEQICETVLFNYNGMVPPTSIGAPTPIGTVAPPVDPDEQISFPSARQMAVLLTTGRMLVWSLGFSGKPKQFIGEVPLRVITAASLAEARFGGVLRLTLRSGAAVDLEAHKGEPSEEFFAQLRALLPDDATTA